MYSTIKNITFHIYIILSQQQSIMQRIKKLKEINLQKNDNNYDDSEELKELDSWDPMAEFYYSSANTIALDHQDPVAFHLGKNLPLDSKIGNVTICEHYARRGKCADGEYCDRLHVSPINRDRIIEIQSKFNYAKNRVLLNVAYLSPQNYVADKNKLLICVITNFRSPNLFHMVVPYDTLDCGVIDDFEHLNFHISHIKTKSDSTRQLKKITRLLQEMFGRTYRIDNVNDPILPSQVVACKYEDRFRRAIVMQSPDRLLNIFDNDYDSIENTHYKLFLMDLGISGWFEREAIYDIKAQCLTDPPLAVTCKLGLKPANGSKEWSREAIDYLKTLVLNNGQYLLCRFTKEHVDLDSFIDGYEVDLLDLKTRKNYGDMLIEKGYASRY